MSPAEKAKVNAILRKESRNMRLSIECKTLFVSVWDAVMKLTAVVKYYFSSDIRNFKNINHPPPIQFLRTNACVCRTSENCKPLVLQGECNIEIFLSPGFLVYIGFILNPTVYSAGLELRQRNRKIIFLFLNQNICCGYS